MDIGKLKHHVKYHIRPYNLGDNGETETLIMELIQEYEFAKSEVQSEERWANHYFQKWQAAQHRVQWTLRLWAWLKNLIGLGLRH